MALDPAQTERLDQIGATIMDQYLHGITMLRLIELKLLLIAIG